jgi:tRNA G18 (ribose-2'-O)-methylase SpoU
VPQLIAITDPDDPRIAVYRDIREADLVGRRGGFIAEGEVVLRTALAAGRHPLASVLLAQKRVEGLADALALLPDETPVYSADQGVLDAIVGFHIHRGVLAHGLRAPDLDPDVLLGALGAKALVVAAFGIGNHDNLGGIFRNAAGFGADAVLLGRDCCDPLYRKAIRVSVGAALTTPFAWLEAGTGAIDLLERHGFTSIALSPAGALPLNRLQRPDRAALLLGAEGPGLPQDMLARATAVSIPMAGRFDSLNVATTSGIALYQLVFGG